MRSAVVALVLLCAPASAFGAARGHIDLNGTWEFRTDPQEEVDAQAWSSGTTPAARTIAVPGAWQAQGVGEPHAALRHDYSGVAWYRRTVAIPADWRGRIVTLRIGGAHRYTTVFVNGTRIGEHRGFSAPFSFDVTGAVRAGEDNIVALQIENPGAAPVEGPREQKPEYPTGMLNYLGNWGGIYGNVELTASDPVRVEQVYIRPDVDQKNVRLQVTVSNGEPRAFSGEVDVSIAPGHEARTTVQIAPEGRAAVDLTVAIPDAHLWSPADPHLYTAVVSVSGGGRERDRIDERFGMRELSTRGNVLLLNGRPLYLRGYGNDNIQVLTGFPPASREVYIERLKLAKSFGFNAMRFHSMTPAEELFQAADEVGMFVMAELPVAYTQYLLPHRDMLRQELHDVVMAYRNRPSFFSIAFGNEFNLHWLRTDAERERFLATVRDFYDLAKSLHPDGLVLSNDGYVMRPTDLVSHFGNGLPDLPVVRHEFGQYYCSLPDISLIDRFTGVYAPEWLEAKKRWVAEHGLSDEYGQYVHNSQKLQQLGRKYQIERVRHRQDVTGYHYWLIVDFPGGTGEGDSWEEGWFDYFWRPKSIEPAEGQAINSAVLPLISAGVGDRTMWSDAPREVEVTISNYGDHDLRDAPLTWKLLEGDRTIASDVVRVTVPMGAVKSVGRIALEGTSAAGPRTMQLVVDVESHANSWTFWSFPRDRRLEAPDVPVYSTVKWAGIQRLYPFVRTEAPAPGGDGVLLTPALDDRALQYLESGGRVWLMAERGRTAARDEVAFFPAAGGALGTMVRDHPALAGFPHEGYGDLQFYNLMDGAVPLPLDRWPPDFRPIIGGIRTTAGFLSKSKDLSRVGYMFEARVGKGKLLVTSLRFREHLDEAYPEVIDLFDRILRYVSGPAFTPDAEAGADQVRALMPPG